MRTIWIHIIYIIYRRSYFQLIKLLSQCIYIKRAWRINLRTNYRYSSIIQTLLLKEKKLNGTSGNALISNFVN